MAREKLLTESEIRRFMKLANMGAVGQAKIEEYGMNYAGARDEDEELESELHATEDELGAEDHEADAEGDELSDLEVSMDDEEPMGDMGDEEKATELAQMIATAVEDIYGVEMSVEGEAPGEEEVEVTDMEVAEVPGPPEDTGEPEPELDIGAEEEEVSMMNEERVVSVVAKRVAARLIKENKKADMVNELTERIFTRLTQK